MYDLLMHAKVELSIDTFINIAYHPKSSFYNIIIEIDSLGPRSGFQTLCIGISYLKS